MFKKIDRLYEEIKAFASIHCNPSVFALQEVFNLEYLQAVKYRLRLKEDGLFVDLKPNRRPITYLNVLGNTIYVK